MTMRIYIENFLILLNCLFLIYIVEATQLAVYCDHHDASSDFPLSLLRNVSLFCKSGGLQGMANAFKLSPSVLTLPLAHALISILCNVKLWLNYRALLQLFTPVRTNALHYMCQLEDSDLRQNSARHMSDFLWSCVKENLDSPISFDKDGLELALKYFTSSTLTMRLAGIAQINSHVNLFNEMCNTESVVEVENVGLQLAAWVLQNGIVEHIFGPNLHVEIIKQSHILLNFLAVEGKITNQHIGVVWQAAQLKHCSKQVHDLLLPLIKNLEAGPVLHLYELLKNLPIKDHTEQTIHLAQVLQKFIWTSGGTFNHLIQEAASTSIGKKTPLTPQKRDIRVSSSSDEDESDKSKNIEKEVEPIMVEVVVKPVISSESVDKKSINSSECDFGIDDLDEDDLNEYSDEEDDEEEEEEEEEEEDEEDDTENEDFQKKQKVSKKKPLAPSTLTSDKDDEIEAKKKNSNDQSNEETDRKLEENAGTPAPEDVKDIPKLVPMKEEEDPNNVSSSFIETEKPIIKDVLSISKGVKRALHEHSSSDSEVGEDSKSESPQLDVKKKLRMSDEQKSSLSLVKSGIAPWWHNASANNPIRWPTGSAMTELANLVNAHPAGPPAFGIRSPEMHEMRPFLRNMGANQREVFTLEEGFSGDNDSVSSRLSNKSDKNLADFEDETSVEEEMLQVAQPQDINAVLHHHQQQQLASLYHQHHRLASAAVATSSSARRQKEETERVTSHYKLESACEPGNTLLWDLLQDGNIENLAEGLATEAEKALTSLLCFNMERFIRMKFVEGCLNNVAKNKSVVISLRLLPKLFQSFQHFRGMDTHEVSMYAERKFGMTNLFFNNLHDYFKSRKSNEVEEPFFNHLAQVQVRLQFLGVLFSIQVSPIDFRLSNDQIHILWECLASDPITSDDLFQWLLIQAHSKEQHAIGLDGFKLIYNEKIPLVKPETISMLGLNLFSQLCQLSRITKQNSLDDDSVKMDQLWKIALCAQNTDVSMKAIQILNTAYFGQGEEFLITCMKSLKNASNDLENGKDETLIRIQRALLLLKTYLETFRRKYAYNFRRLSIDGLGVSTHAELVELRSIGSIRVVVQAAGFQDKVTFEMQPMDLVADLRAEISAWWEGKTSREKKTSSPLLGSMLNEGPLRIITQGQEITSDTDEKSLVEMGFKDLQMVFVSQGANGSSRTPTMGNRSGNIDLPPFPGKDKMPMNLLLNPEHFEQLFSLMNNLSTLRLKNEKSEAIPHTKAQILSRRVWDILMLLPTNPEIKEKLLTIEDRAEEEIKDLLSPSSPQKLMYTFYIVDWLGRPARLRRQSGVMENMTVEEFSPTTGNIWINKFILSGGLRHLFDIFTSGVLQYNEETRMWCEWKQDCLSALIKLLVQFGVDSEDYDALADQIIEDSPPKKKLRGKRKFSGPDRLLVPRLSQTMLDLMNVDVVMPQITSVLLEVSRVKDPNQYRTGVFGRAQVVHFCLSLLVAWIYSMNDIEDALLSSNGLPAWLRHLVLEDYDPAVRREMCTGLYKLCMGSTTSGKTGVSVTGPMLSILLEFLDDALLMKPVKRENHVVEEGKEPYGPACRDYFWILCRLTDIIRNDNDTSGLVDLDQLSRQLACGLVSRKFYEKRHGDPSPDDALVGTLNLLCAVMKHQPSFKISSEGQEFILHLWECLFALPSPREKNLPKCKSNASRTACYDLLIEMCKGSLQNYLIIHEKLMTQHEADAHKPYQWEYWPRDDGRAECGYVGLTNLGATCYMATCVQQLYMIPEARSAILKADLNSNGKHSNTLYELQRMFAYLRDSERKAYNPLSFCKTYQMDHQPLNTGEQKDMAEFFIDLLSKIEEMTPDIKHVIKDIFCGTLTNNVVSLDCNHVSKTIEEFYTVRCQVSELRNLHQSLEEVTVKDTLEGDNMYTCSQCGKKVRAEKRACFKKLPKILAFNTMRYTFNMITMLKEKVNTHFSFPFCLDMSPYMEKNLIPGKSEKEDQDNESTKGYEYEIIGVTVHTGTADGGHYYAFIRSSQKDKWYSFNDAEVKPFDQNQIASECFGGEMNSRTYDQVTDKFMDLSIEKTNSAYMLFYERVEPSSSASQAGPSTSLASEANETPLVKNIDLSQNLEEWIWQDNMNFIQDNNIFDHTYFNFMWQMVGSIPTTISGQKANEDITLLSGKLATSFFLESFIHAKEKLNIVQWVELLTKQFDSSTAACSWFLNHMARDNHWPVTIFLKCQVQTIRQMFHRLCIHVIQKLRPMEKELYMQPWLPKESDERYPSEEVRSLIGASSPITRFIRMLLRLLESGSARPHLKHLTELFRFLYDFSKLGEEETNFLLSVNTITIYADFYLKAIKQNHDNMITIDVISDDEDDDDDIIALTPIAESSKMASLDKMVCLIALLVEKSRGDDNLIHLSESDTNALTGGKSLVFLFNITKDNINTCQTCNLIFSLTRNNPELAEQVAGMVFAGVKQADFSMHFFRLLTLLTEFSGGPSGMPCFTNLVMHKVWELAKTCPQAALDWLSIQVTRNRYVQTWLVSTLENWVEQYLIAHPNQKVRNSASFLVVSLVPSNHFRQAFRTARSSTVILDSEERDILHQVIEFLFGLLLNCRHYADLQQHGSAKLVAYFQTMSHFLLSRTEKLMFEPHFLNLWQLFHPKLSEPSIPIHHNKQALLNFWYNLCMDCTENVRMILSNPNVTKNIAFNYILADHEDTEVINFNRIMLPTYYGLLRLCCIQSRSFTRQLAQHQNIHWAFKNITPYTTQYTVACDELFKLMALFVQKFPEEEQHERSSDEVHNDDDEEDEIRSFRHQTLQLYLSILDGRSSWSTLINALKILIDTNEDKIFVVYNNGLALIFDALNMLHMMLHEATACHVTGELIELLTIFLELVKAVRCQRNNSEIRQILSRWKDMSEMTGRMLTLCNSFNPPDLRNVCLSGIKEMLLLWPTEMLNILVPMLHRAHTNSSDMDSVGLGPYFPRKGSPNIPALKTIRPPRPMFQMAVPASQLLAHHGQDPEYDRSLQQYFAQYHATVDLMVRVSVNENNLTKMLVDLSAMVGLDGVSLHMQLFPKLWTDIHNTQLIDRKFILMLISSHGFLEYVDAVLLDERSSLNNPHIFNFLLLFFPKVSNQVLTEQVQSIISQLVSNFIDMAGTFVLDRVTPVRHLNGDLRALFLVSSSRSNFLSDELLQALKILRSSVEKKLEGKGRPSSEEICELNKSEVFVEGKSFLDSENVEESAPSTSSKNNHPCSISTDIDDSDISKKLETTTSSAEELRKSADCKLIDALSVLFRTLILLVQMSEKKLKGKEDKTSDKEEAQDNNSELDKQKASSSKEGDEDKLEEDECQEKKPTLC
ncbi:ubiquitin carboxyl-terminal hydrolase 34 [Lepeophtheirus salmonis]|uniref:ubiquitin carboxyl-terminal hydrolase 34 n=1 Tax=Lepeophtheirus salmonis TaxID=72036 RepID=UPI003AF3D2AE